MAKRRHARDALDVRGLREVKREVKPSPKGRDREGVEIFARVPPDLNAALRRVLTERRLAGDPPYLLRDVLVSALRDWLDRHGKGQSKGSRAIRKSHKPRG